MQVDFTIEPQSYPVIAIHHLPGHQGVAWLIGRPEAVTPTQKTEEVNGEKGRRQQVECCRITGFLLAVVLRLFFFHCQKWSVCNLAPV